MGDAADEAWDDMFSRQMDLDLMVKGIRERCDLECRIANSEQDIEEETWLPYVCLTCGERFDFP